MADGSLWRNRDFLRLWLAQAISQTAHHTVHYAILVLVQTRTNSSVQMGIAVMTLVLPSVIFGLVAGAYVDRRDKRLVLVGTTALRAVTMLGYVLFTDSLLLVYLTNFVAATINQFFMPAEMAMLPAVVGRKRLIQANSLFHLTFTASQLGGLVLLGPLLVSLFGLDALFMLVVAATAACVAILWWLPSTHRPVPDAEQHVRGFSALWGEVRAVLGYVRTDRGLSWAVAYWTCAASLAVIMATLAPGFVVNVLGIRAEDSIFVLAPVGVGMVVGTAVLSRLGPGLDKYRAIGIGVRVVGVALVFLAVAPTAWRWLSGLDGAANEGAAAAPWLLIGLVMATALLAGVAFVGVIVPSQTIIQERAPEAMRGRVFAVQLVLSNVVGVAPLLLLGELADLVGVDVTLVVLGLLILVLGWLGGRLVRADDAATGHPAAEPGPAA